jgi:exoribonuclease R
MNVLCHIEKEEDICEIKGGTVPTGRVVGIFQRNWRPYCGSFEETDKEQGTVLFLSVNRRLPKIKVRILDTIVTLMILKPLLTRLTRLSRLSHLT